MSVTKLTRACQGTGPTGGGLSIKDLRSELIKRYPDKEDVINKTKRKDLEKQFCHEILSPTKVKLVQIKLPKLTADQKVELLNASKGKTAKTGGLNMDNFRSYMIAKYPDRRDEILLSSRKEIQEIYKGTKPVQQIIGDPDMQAYFMPGTPLSKQQQSYCRCTMHQPSKQPKWCLEDLRNQQRKTKIVKKNGKEVTEKCYDPFPICTKSVKRTGSFACFPHYDFTSTTKIPPEEIEAQTWMVKKSVDDYKRDWIVKRKMFGLPIPEQKK